MRLFRKGKSLTFQICRISLFVLCFLAVMVGQTVIPGVIQAKGIEVIYPQRESQTDMRDNDLVELLQMSLEKTIPTDGQFLLRPTYTFTNEKRNRYLLRLNKEVSIIWSSVTKDLEKDLLPIRIPLRKGILGYRVFLIRKQDKDKFAAVKTLDDLRKLTAGQGQTWNDVEVFKANKISVVTGSDYETLFRMLMFGRFDFFSRGINEAPSELKARKKQYPDMMLEETILLYYPWPKFFYVNKSNSKLADRIERGLKIMIKDGSFEKLFLKYNQRHIDAVNLKNRRLIRLSNPLLPATVPLERKELWYDPFNSI
jgi:hypothetical protein